MTVDEIAKAAYNGKELDGLCCLSDFHLHTCLCRLYDDFRAGKITKDDANTLKSKLIAAYNSDKKTVQAWEAMTTAYAENVRSVSGLNPEKAKTKAECIQILSQIVASLTGDTSLPERMREKWK
jgi:hypothetical protein